jgi:hypothetical protein
VQTQLVALSSAARGRTEEPVRSAGRTDTETEIAYQICDAAAQLCRSRTATRVADRLAKVARALAADCPQVAKLWREILERLVHEFPYTEAAALWPQLLELRARFDLPPLPVR